MGARLWQFVCLFSILTLVSIPGLPAGEVENKTTVYWDSIDEDGNLIGGRIELDIGEAPQSLLGVDAEVVTVLDNGDEDNRVNLVFVGDGYTEDDLDDYEDHVDNALADLFDVEPFTTYEPLFNAYRVEVISEESGVDGDPDEDDTVDTELNMGFFCGGTERLLCVSTFIAREYADLAPAVDQIFAVANSTKYGGAGYSSLNIATFAGGNSSAAQVAIHELGHSLGNLADEYDYNNNLTYSGSEPGAPNASIYDADDMEDDERKWHRWLGVDDSYGGEVDTYEGCAYYEFGIYRPTANSMMRSLSRPFNHPSIEAFIIEIYKLVDPIDDHTDTGEVLSETDEIFVEILEPDGHDLDVEWFLDDELLEDETGTTLDLSAIGLTDGEHEVTVVVTDNTDFVRDEDAREDYMTMSVTWDVEIDCEEGPTIESVATEQLASEGDDALTVAFSIETSGGDPTAYKWTMEPGRVRRVAAPEYQFPLPGTYTITVEVENFCGTDDYEFDVTVTGTAFERGDVDGDGRVMGVGDAIHLLNWGFNDGNDPPCLDAADVDDDGETNALVDTMALLGWAYLSDEPPPAPGPGECDIDPTEDSVDCDESGCL